MEKANKHEEGLHSPLLLVITPTTVHSIDAYGIANGREEGVLSRLFTNKGRFNRYSIPTGLFLGAQIFSTDIASLRDDAS